MRFNKTKLLSYGIVLSMTAVSMLSTSPIASAAGNVKDEEYSYVKGLDEDPFYTRWREKKNTSKVYCYPKNSADYDKLRDAHLEKIKKEESKKVKKKTGT